MGSKNVGYRNLPPIAYVTTTNWLIELNVLNLPGQKLDERGWTPDEKEIMDDAAEKIARASANYL